ncbi:cytochrome P450 [Actinomadura viridis]|uniref:P450-derived glycosyltransferase activator n=1 Tax=Actinomadura viridis TaxID=58110 RepID=A0A931GGY9_9ACTN|nr:P450-derived glycosyltransferase activator [Actinomadura viridis]MBG6086855.1 P450-derived glycosyltransferase activator [Actinomadura viridis]
MITDIGGAAPGAAGRGPAYDPAYGRGLLLTRAAQWYCGTQGDLYALVLRGQDDDPYPYYEKIRELGPLYTGELGTPATADHAVASRVLGDPRFGPGDPPGSVLAGSVPTGSVPAKAVQAGAVQAGAVQAGAVPDLAGHRSEVARLCREALDRLGRAGAAFDLIGDLFGPVCAAATAGLFGVAGQDRERFARHAAGLGGALDAPVCPQPYERVRAIADATAGLGDLVGGEPDGAAARVTAAIVALETVPTLAGNAVAALVGPSGTWAALRADPRSARAAIGETLRHDPPIQLVVRTAREDVEIAGRRLAAGTRVAVLTGGAGRDPGAYPDPARFDLTRSPGPEPPAFGGSSPYAPAGPLVRLQAEALLETLARERPGLRRNGEALRRRRAPVVRGLLNLPVTA